MTYQVKINMQNKTNPKNSKTIMKYPIRIEAFKSSSLKSNWHIINTKILNVQSPTSVKTAHAQSTHTNVLWQISVHINVLSL